MFFINTLWSEIHVDYFWETYVLECDTLQRSSYAEGDRLCYAPLTTFSLSYKLLLRLTSPVEDCIVGGTNKRFVLLKTVLLRDTKYSETGSDSTIFMPS